MIFFPFFLLCYNEFKERQTSVEHINYICLLSNSYNYIKYHICMILLISKQMTDLQCITDLTLKFYFKVRIETQTEYLCGGTYSTLQSSAIK